ncbi:MAG: respiratory nitrate reductase subunit gamma, partial [Acidimicrobiaceae bacterium]|nr:respiratory nitrate reductase subunit gamma [Acidimicrobiaceae bacterium]
MSAPPPRNPRADLTTRLGKTGCNPSGIRPSGAHSLLSLVITRRTPIHYGTFAAIGGHVLGVLTPERWTAAIGIPENAYRWFSAAAGTLAAVLIIVGVAFLAGRRLFVPRVRATTSPVDGVAVQPAGARLERP